MLVAIASSGAHVIVLSAYFSRESPRVRAVVDNTRVCVPAGALEEVILAEHQTDEHYEDEDGGDGGYAHDNAHCFPGAQTAPICGIWRKERNCEN